MENTEKELCSIGCGQVGLFYSKRTKKWRCSKHTGACPELKRKRQKTFDEKYGGNPMKDKSVAEKCRESGKSSLLKKYGVDNPMKIDSVAQRSKERREQTLIERYGVQYPLQIEEAKNKSAETRLKTVQSKYGVSNVFELEDIQSKAQTNRKAAMSEKYGCTNPMDIPGVPEKAARLAKQHLKGSQNAWLDSLGIDDDMREQSVTLSDGSYIIADGFNSDTNTVYEFWGDYWHGNPDVYLMEDLNPTCSKTFGELFRLTEEKRRRILDSGFNLVEIWETDFKRQSP